MEVENSNYLHDVWFVPNFAEFTTNPYPYLGHDFKKDDFEFVNFPEPISKIETSSKKFIKEKRNLPGFYDVAIRILPKIESTSKTVIISSVFFTPNCVLKFSNWLRDHCEFNTILIVDSNSLGKFFSINKLIKVNAKYVTTPEKKETFKLKN